MWYIVLSRSLPEQEKTKSFITKSTGNGWRINIARADCSFRAPRRTAPMAFTSCWQRKDEAERTAAQDPHHARGIRAMEVLEWNAHRAFRLDGPTIADVEDMARGK
jgi:hypothetical protein